MAKKPILENSRVGPFLIGRRIGRNRRQHVYRARQTEQNIDVAIKFIGFPDDAQRRQAIEKIKIEFDVLRELEHPNLAKILGAGIESEQIFVVSELVKGESLSSLLTRRGKFAPDQVVDVARQTASLLDYLHGQQIIHSKLTPDKILINKEGAVKVTDVRLNRSRKKRWDSANQRELDIAAYMAPEQFTQGATEKSDIYALGVILYEMLTGQLPFAPDTMNRMARKKKRPPPPVASIVMNCPAWLDKIVGEMVAPDPRQRPHSAKAIVLAMQELTQMDASKKSAVSKVSGKFSPLTAGSDKSEARRILGKKEKREFDPAIFQSTPFLIIGLLLIVAVIVIGTWPKNSQQNLAAAVSLMESEDSSDWLRARDYLKKIMAQGDDDPLYSQAETLYFESRKRTLVQQAERGQIIGLQSKHSQQFIKAYRAVRAGELQPAAEIFLNLVSDGVVSDSQRHIVELSSENLQDLVLNWPVPADTAELNEVLTFFFTHGLPAEIKGKLVARLRAEIKDDSLQDELELILKKFDRSNPKSSG